MKSVKSVQFSIDFSTTFLIFSLAILTPYKSIFPKLFLNFP